MDKFQLLQFQALLKREVLEHKNLFIWAPVVLGLLIFVIDFLIISSLSEEDLESFLNSLTRFFANGQPLDMAPAFVFPTLPFLGILYICAILYLTNTLYQDRKELSILFWQSMPVSNFKTVLSKLVAIIVIAPIFYVAVIFALYVIGILWLIVSGLNHGVEVAGLGYMFLTATFSLPIVYLFAVTSVLWLLPFIGWLILFSAFANRTPLLWAIGSLALILFLEGFIFGSSFLSNWIETRSDIDNFIIVEYGGVFDRLFSYDMLVGLVIGSMLITGAVYMRRFVD
jgi:ABC-2 type transport system permease protein